MTRLTRIQLVLAFCTILCFFVAPSNTHCRAPEMSILVDSQFFSLEFASGGDYLFVYDLDTIQRYDLTMGHVDQELQEPLYLSSIAIRDDGAVLAVVASEVELLDVESGRTLRTYSLPRAIEDDFNVGRVEFIGDRKLLLEEAYPRFHVVDLLTADWYLSRRWRSPVDFHRWCRSAEAGPRH